MVSTNRLVRLWQHWVCTTGRAASTYGADGLKRIEQVISDGEKLHSCEIRFVVESNLDSTEVWHHIRPRDRAMHLFGQLNIWDTAQNNGLLVYVLLADRAIEIVVDRSIREVLPDSHWQEVLAQISAAYKAGDFTDSTINALDLISKDLAVHFAPIAGDKNELPNKATLI